MALLRVQESATEYYGFDHEYQLSIVETRTGICRDLGELRDQLGALRASLDRAAASSALTVMAAGTMPTTGWRDLPITPKARYAEILEHYQDVVQRRATCGCHVHVGIEDRELAVQVLNRVGPWLPVLLALSSSSPFYEGADTGYQSYRTMLWSGFPVAGPPPIHASHQEYTDRIQLLMDSGTILDTGHIYWDARLGTRSRTLEFRVADVCPTIDDTILQAALSRALAATCIEEIAHDRPPLLALPGLARAAMWRAARSGLDGLLIDPTTAEAIPALAMVDRLLIHVRDALEQAGDWKEVLDLVERVRHRGTSARRQRETLTRSGHLAAVVDHLSAETTQTSS